MRERVKVYVQPICGDAPCPDDDDPSSGALIVRRITVDGGEIPFTKARIETNAQEFVSVVLELIPGGIEILSKSNPWEEVT